MLQATQTAQVAGIVAGMQLQMLYVQLSPVIASKRCNMSQHMSSLSGVVIREVVPS